MEDYRDFHSEGVYKATYTIYHQYTMGVGPNRDGIMLLLSMDDRDWAMFCYGSHCEYAFNSYGQEKLEKVFLDNFGEDDWYGGQCIRKSNRKRLRRRGAPAYGANRSFYP